MGENREAVRLQLKLKLRPSPPPPAAAAPAPAPARRRRNSIATSVVVQPLPPAAAKPTPAHSLSFPNGTAADAPPPPLDLSGHAFASYTSLKDILPAVSSPAGSPTASAAAAAAAASSSYEISIRNRLVNRAAWAYLRPMSASPGSDGPHLLRRLWLRLSACLGFVFDRIVRFFSQLRPGR